MRPLFLAYRLPFSPYVFTCCISQGFTDKQNQQDEWIYIYIYMERDGYMHLHVYIYVAREREIKRFILRNWLAQLCRLWK